MPGKGQLLACVSCGAYAWAGARALTQKCLGSEATPGLQGQKSRLARGMFPATSRDLRIELHPPSQATIAWLLHRAELRTGAAGLSPAPEGPQAWQTEIVQASRSDMLACYGLDEAGLLLWSLKALERRNRGKTEEEAEDDAI